MAEGALPSGRRGLLMLALGLATLGVAGGAGVAEPGAAAGAREGAESASRGGWQPDPALLADLQRRNTSWMYREADVPSYRLPDVLAGAKDRREWERKRRAETLELFREWVYGRAPAKPDKVRAEVLSEDAEALEGRATLKQLRITSRSEGKEFSFPAALFVPNKRRGRVPAFILINNRAESSADPSRRQKDGFWPVEEIVGRGYAAAMFRTNDVDPDTKDESARVRGVRGVWPEGGGKAGEDAWATISAWAWGASRVMDALQADPAVDGKKVGLVGHSRGGKTALWAGAQDERFALVVSNNSGEGGAALSRRRFGETVEAINRGFPYWFAANFKKFNCREEALPVDQHQLLALIAPRPLYVASADADFWADPRGEFLALAHASPVYALYGEEEIRADEMPPLDTPLFRGKRGYHIRRGIHNLTAYDWERFMDLGDRVWKRGRSR